MKMLPSARPLRLICFAVSLLFFVTAFSPVDDPSPDVSILLKTCVDNLRLRAAPDPQAAVLVEMPEGAHLEYLFKTDGPLTEITLRGVKKSGRWHKVRWSSSYEAPKTVEGWVFAGGVRAERIMGSGDLVKGLNGDFFQVDTVSKAQLWEDQMTRKLVWSKKPNECWLEWAVFSEKEGSKTFYYKIVIKNV